MARHVDALERYRPRALSRFWAVKTRRPGLPVMMVPAYGDERRRRAAKAGAHQFLTKPVDFAKLKEELRRLSPTFV
jgi:DNA-binding NtrC family response regulator